MKVPHQADRPQHTQLTSEAQAESLCYYVQTRAPGFTLDSARDVVARLQVCPGEDPKPLAKRLRLLLQTHRVALKHTNALHAASRLAGFTSWHNNRDADVQRLTFVTFDAGLVREAHFRSWDDLANELRN